jgi:hypothetical protein
MITVGIYLVLELIRKILRTKRKNEKMKRNNIIEDTLFVIDYYRKKKSFEK